LAAAAPDTRFGQTGITGAVVLVVTEMGAENAWQQPLLRLVDTISGVVIGVSYKWIGSCIFYGVACGLGAVCEARFGLNALALPPGLALVALAMGVATKLEKPADQVMGIVKRGATFLFGSTTSG
jgi:hypothetical protein